MKRLTIHNIVQICSFKFTDKEYHLRLNILQTIPISINTLTIIFLKYKEKFSIKLSIYAIWYIISLFNGLIHKIISIKKSSEIKYQVYKNPISKIELIEKIQVQDNKHKYRLSVIVHSYMISLWPGMLNEC